MMSPDIKTNVMVRGESHVVAFLNAAADNMALIFEDEAVPGGKYLHLEKRRHLQAAIRYGKRRFGPLLAILHGRHGKPK